MPQDNYADRPHQELVDKALQDSLGQVGISLDGRPMSQSDSGPNGVKAFFRIEGNDRLTPQEKLHAHQEMMTRLGAATRPELGFTSLSDSHKEYLEVALEVYGPEALQDMQSKISTSLEQQVKASLDQPFGTGRSTRASGSSPEAQVDGAISRALRSVDNTSLIGNPNFPSTRSFDNNVGAGQQIFRDIESRHDLTADQKQMAYQEITAQIMRNGRLGSGPDSEGNLDSRMEREQGFLQAYSNKYGQQALVTIESAKQLAQQESQKLNYAERPSQEAVDKALKDSLGQVGISPDGRTMSQSDPAPNGVKAFFRIEGNDRLTPQEKLHAHQEMMTRLGAATRPELGFTSLSDSHKEYLEVALEVYGPEALQDMQSKISTSLEQQVKASLDQPFGTGRSTRASGSSPEAQVDGAISRALRSVDNTSLIGNPNFPSTRSFDTNVEAGQQIFRDIESRHDLTADQKQMAYQEITAQIMRNGRLGSGPDSEGNLDSRMEREQGFLQAYSNKYGQQALVTIESAKQLAQQESQKLNYAERPSQEAVDKALKDSLGQVGISPDGRTISQSDSDPNGVKAFYRIEGNDNLTPQEKLHAHQEMMTRLSAATRPELGFTSLSDNHKEYLEAALEVYGPEALQDMQSKISTSLEQQVKASLDQPFGTGRSTRASGSSPEAKVDGAISRALGSVDNWSLIGDPNFPSTRSFDTNVEAGQLIFRDIESRHDLSAAQKQMAYQEITAQIMRNGRLGSGPDSNGHLDARMEREQGFLQAYSNKYGEQALATIDTAKAVVAKEQAHQKSIEQAQTESPSLETGTEVHPEEVSQSQEISQGDDQQPSLEQGQTETPELSEPQEISQGNDQQESLQQSQTEAPPPDEVTDLQQEKEVAVSLPQEVSKGESVQESAKQIQKEKPSVGEGVGATAKQTPPDPEKLSEGEGQQQKRSVRDSLGSKAWSGASAPKNGQQRSVRDAIGGHRGEPKEGNDTAVKIGGHRSR